MATPEREPAGSRQCRMRPSLRGGFKWASLAFVRSAALVWLVLAAACTSYGKTVEDEQQEAYARAYVALIAKHPDALADLSRNVGARPSSCDLAYGGAAVPAAVCACTWRFLTKEGAKEITATAMFRDPRDSEVDTVTMLRWTRAGPWRWPPTTPSGPFEPARAGSFCATAGSPFRPATADSGRLTARESTPRSRTGRT